MSTMTNDAVTPASHTKVASGVGFALVAAASFGLSGSLAKGLMDIGWTAGSAVLLRVTIAALVLAIPGALALRGRWHLLARNAGSVLPTASSPSPERNCSTSWLCRPSTSRSRCSSSTSRRLPWCCGCGSARATSQPALQVSAPRSRRWASSSSSMSSAACSSAS